MLKQALRTFCQPIPNIIELQKPEYIKRMQSWFSKMMLILVALTLVIPFEVSCYNILIIFPTPTFSHQQPAMALTEALVKRGHQLYVVSPNVVPGLEKNYTFVDVNYDKNPAFSKEKKSLFQRQNSKWDLLKMMPIILMTPEIQFKTEAFQQFTRQIKENNIHFDVIIGELIYAPHICGMTDYLAKGKPIMGLSTLGCDFFGEAALGSIFHPSYTPTIFSTYSDRMTLWQKLDNWYTALYMEYKAKQLGWDMAKKFFQENYELWKTSPERMEESCYRRITLTLISSNFFYAYPRLLPPNVIEVGPTHIKPPQKLPKILQDWLDGAEIGVVYMSLGSGMQSRNLPPDAISNLIQVFKELPSGYRVLWKWEDDGKIPGQPDNILTHKWMPQQSILAHPKVVVFITQGGLQSFQETVHFGVPVIGVPWFGDQEFNVAKMVQAGIGTRLLPQQLLSYEAIRTAISAVLFDASYATNMKKLSAISRDFTTSALDKAVFWVEHVAKHGAADHLRPSTVGTTYFEYFCLDILSVILAISLTVIGTSVVVLKYLILIIRPKLGFKMKQS